jgi:hypothetical protein
VLLGRLLYRLDDWATADAHYAFAHTLAGHAAYTDLQATALVLRSYLHSAIPRCRPIADTKRAIALLDQAEEGGSRLPPLLQVWICARRAEEYASIRNRNASMHNLGQASRFLALVTTDTPTPGLLATWSPARLAGYRGNCLLLLGDTQAAIRELSAARDATSPSLLAERVAVLTDLAAATARSGALDEACTQLAIAMADAQRHGLSSSMQRIVGTRQRFFPPAHKQLPALRELDERIEALEAPWQTAP